MLFPYEITCQRPRYYYLIVFSLLEIILLICTYPRQHKSRFFLFLKDYFLLSLGTGEARLVLTFFEYLPLPPLRKTFPVRCHIIVPVHERTVLKLVMAGLFEYPIICGIGNFYLKSLFRLYSSDCNGGDAFFHSSAVVHFGSMQTSWTG